jgi:tetratricopeptide (TPR) repeat protein
LSAADEHAERALEAARSESLSFREADVRRVQGEIALQQVDNEGALVHLTAALDLARRAGVVSVVIDVLRASVDALARIGSDDALSYLEKAWALASRAGLPDQAAEIAARLNAVGAER